MIPRRMAAARPHWQREAWEQEDLFISFYILLLCILDSNPQIISGGMAAHSGGRVLDTTLA